MKDLSLIEQSDVSQWDSHSNSQEAVLADLGISQSCKAGIRCYRVLSVMFRSVSGSTLRLLVLGAFELYQRSRDARFFFFPSSSAVSINTFNEVGACSLVRDIASKYGVSLETQFVSKVTKSLFLSGRRVGMSYCPACGMSYLS